MMTDSSNTPWQLEQLRAQRGDLWDRSSKLYFRVDELLR
jgi:hypothetical protein